MRTHNEFFRAGKIVDAYLLFEKETKLNWSFIKYVKVML